MINLIIKDGLGNQMFQYAYARYVQECYKRIGYNETLVINPYFIKHRVFKDNDKRDISLHHFFLNDNVKIQEVSKQKKSYIQFRIRTLFATNLFDLYNWIFRGKKPLGEIKFIQRARKGLYYTFGPYTFFELPLSKVKNKYIFGFFQDERNFRIISETIKKELLVKDVPSERNLNFIEKIQKTNSVCLHIRRGDYLNPKWKNLQICDFKYYNDSLNYILNRVDNPIFYVFSNSHDDLEWIKANYHFRDLSGNRHIQLEYVDLSNPDYEELRLMYNCKHFIISNSTFSWWGAYLANYEEKIVIAPNRWNLDEDNDSDIYLNNWIKIGNR